MLSSRNQEGLTDREIERCEQIWEVLGGNECCSLDVSQASSSGSRTRFNQPQNVVFLGADVMPGRGTDARSRMSELACLAHELAYAQRYEKHYDRPDTEILNAIDEAETSLHASFMQPLSTKDRYDLRDDAREQITRGLTISVSQEANHEN